MRKLTILLLVALLALAAVACGDEEGEEATTTAAAGEETTTTEAAGGEVVLTVGETPFTMAELEALGVETLNLEHPKNGPGDYTGVRLSAVLGAAGIDESAASLTFMASDGFEYEAAPADVLACTDCLLAFDEGTLRLAMPGMESKAWVKDIVEIAVG